MSHLRHRRQGGRTTGERSRTIGTLSQRSLADDGPRRSGVGLYEHMPPNPFHVPVSPPLSPP
ncbi:MAG: hypothetical protein LC776_19260, partial [Acidobacteria bacterium]|nr:hypothetical protein [Acidobacteriota bacterium]